MVTLVGRYASPFVRRVAVTLQALGIPYERQVISSLTDQDKLRAVNPVGRVPALVLDDGEALIDSAAILDYIDEIAGPERALTPPRGAARRKVLKTTALMTGAVEKVVATLYERNRRPPEKVHQPWIDHCTGQALSALTTLEAEAGKSWLVGDRMTQADVTVAVGYDFLRRTQAALVPDGKFPKLAALSARCENLPAFQNARPEV